MKICETTSIGKNLEQKEFSIIRRNVFIGDNVRIMELCTIGSQPQMIDIKTYKMKPPNGRIVIGNNVFINTGSTVVMGGEKDTIIEDDVTIAQGVIIGHDSHIGKRVQIMNSCMINGHVTIGDDTYLGTGANIKNRITVGKNCLIGMGSVVTKDIPDNVVAWGNPCEVKRGNSNVDIIVAGVRRKTKGVLCKIFT